MKPLLHALCLCTASLFQAAAQAQAAGPWYEVSGGDWQVPASTIADMRKRIDAAARDAAPRSVTREVRSVLNDTVQYQGIVNHRTGRKLVELYGMCKTEKSPAELRDFWRHTMDGGNCYYQARYDPIQKRFLSFDFNSAA